MEQTHEIFELLLRIGCCKCCCVRYLCDKSVDFDETDKYIEKHGYISKSKTNENELKKVKSNPCIVCLGLLQDFTINEILHHPDLKTVEEYDSDVFTCSISMPASILVREHGMRLYLEDKFPTFFNDENREIPLNRAWKMVIRNQLGALINKTFENSDVCNFSINISMDYEHDVKELSVLKEMQPKIFEQRATQHRKFNGELYSRKVVLNVLELTPSGVFKTNSQTPPDIPNKGLTCKRIECKHNSIYIAGRYCKYSRNLSQSPWIIDGVRAMESSVQEIIFQDISKILSTKEENLKFSASGREDCDVRCLGKGRPFYVEIVDPKKTKFTFEQFRELERLINRSTQIKVKDLQLVPRTDLNKIKAGEESKKKTYNALCIVKTPVTQEMIDKINSYGPVELLQKTPIRVLHRRPLAIRNRMIYEMKATRIEGKEHLFELYMVTQAGTYVKEFVHGDFKRTKPSVGDIIEADVDIIALDVLSIDLDWPEEISSERNQHKN